ncbi:MAG: hypothetical protein ACOCVF_01505 [bacterium]
MKLDNKTFIIALLIFLLGGGLLLHLNQVSELRDTIKLKDKLTAALTDSVRTYKTKEGTWRSEKLTLQTKLKDLLDGNITLTKSQEKLLNRVKKLNKEKEVISAALVDAEITIKNLTDSLQKVNINLDDSTVTFINRKNKFLKYKFTAFNVLPSSKSAFPYLRIDDLNIPFETTIAFNWETSKEFGVKYPVSFSIEYDNPYLQINNIDSYAIPKLRKEIVNPNFWQKLGNFTNKSGTKVFIFGGGVIIGLLLAN